MISYLIAAALVAIVALVASQSIWAAIVGFLVGGVFAYLGQPVMAYGFAGLTVLVLVGVSIGLTFSLTSVEVGQSRARKGVAIGTTVVAFLFAFAVPFFTSSSIFHAAQYRNLIGAVDTL